MVHYRRPHGSVCQAASYVICQRSLALVSKLLVILAHDHGSDEVVPGVRLPRFL